MDEYGKIKTQLEGKMSELLLDEDSGIYESFNNGLRTMFFASCSIILDYLMQKKKAEEKHE